MLKASLRSSQKSLVIKIFAVGHRKIVDFSALAKNDKQLSFLQKSDAFLPQFNAPKSFLTYILNIIYPGNVKVD